MKNHLLIFFFTFPFLLSAQQAFYQTRTIVDYEDLLLREDIQELTTIYLEKTDFDANLKAEVDILLKFIEDPFREDLNYFELSTDGIVSLDYLIKNNLSEKENIRERDYELILECDSLFPATYELFLEEDKAVLDNELLECFDQKLKNKYPTNYGEELEEIALEHAPQPSYSVGDAQLSNQAPTSPLSFSTKVIDATSQFLVERVKEELLLSFFDRFLTNIDNSTELTSLMPNTYFLLKNNDIFKVPSMGEVWVSAFEEDIEGLLPNLENMLTSHPDYLTIREAPNFQYFLIAGYIYQQIKVNEDFSISQQLNLFHEKFVDSDLQAIKMLGVVNLLSNNLKLEDAVDEWIPLKSFKNLFNREENASLYFSGLLYQQDRELFKNIEIKTQNETDQFDHQIKNNVRAFTEKAGKFLSSIQQLKTSKSALIPSVMIDDPKALASSFYDAKFSYSLAIFDLLDYGIDLAYFKHPEELANSTYHNILRPLAIKSIQTYDAAQRGEHGEMLLHSMQLLEPLIQVRIDRLEQKFVASSNNVTTDKNLALENKKLEKEIKILQGVVKNYIYYGGFMVDVLSAKSTPEIKSIIYKYAEPAGSYRVKRQSDFSVSLSSYPGLYFGLESISNNNANTSFVTGVTAPIGLSLNWGNKLMGNRKKEHSLSLYFPIIDIGAAFSYRWKNDEGEGFPENIKWQQVLSPGVHSVWGIGNTPMALMVGAQYTPLLRNITDENNILKPNAWRFGATITVDIPFFHFYKSSSW